MPSNHPSCPPHDIMSSGETQNGGQPTHISHLGLLVLHSRFSFCMQILLISLKLQQTAVANQLCNNIHQVIITVILLRRRSELNWHPARLHGYCRWMWTVGVHSWWIVSFCHLTTTLSFKVQNCGSHHCCHLKSLWSGMCSAHTHWCPESAVL